MTVVDPKPVTRLGGVALPLALYMCYLSISSLMVLLLNNTEALVMTDELTYSRDILYGNPWVFSASNSFHVLVLMAARFFEDWYLAVRLGNAVFLSIGALSIFLIARRGQRASISITAGLFYIFAPISLFVMTAMPDALVWGLTPFAFLLMTRVIEEFSSKRMMALILILTVLTLVKPQTFVLVLVVLVTVFINQRMKLAKWISWMGIFAGFRTALALIIGGPVSLSPAGRYFDFGLSKIFDLDVYHWPDYFNTYPEATQSLLAPDPSLAAVSTVLPYLGAMMILASPLIGTMVLWRPSVIHDSRMAMLQAISWTWFLLTLLAYFFGVYVTAIGDDHSGRILLRYSEFLIPIYLLALLSIGSGHNLKFIHWPTALMSAALGVVIYAANGLGTINVTGADSVLIQSVTTSLGSHLLYLMGITLVVLSLVMKLPPVGSDTMKILGLAIVLLIFTTYTAATVASANEESVERSAAESVVPIKGESKVMFIGESRLRGAMGLFYLNDLNSSYGLGPPFVSLLGSAADPEAELFVLLGDSKVGQGFRPLAKGQGFIILERREEGGTDYSALLDLPPGVLTDPLTEAGVDRFWTKDSEYQISFSDSATNQGDLISIDATTHISAQDGIIEVSINDGDWQKIDTRSERYSGAVQFFAPEGLRNVKLRAKLTKFDVPGLDERFGTIFGIGLSSVLVTPQ